MKSVLLIGMGKFGQTLGQKLLDMGDEVLIVDKNEDTVNSLAPMYTNALIANCMNVNNLKKMDIPSFDVCIVAIGDDFQSSLEITSLLKECGAKYVVAKAATDIQRKFLLRNGADEVVYPERDIAEKLAIRHNAKNIFDFVEVTDDFAIFEIPILKKWTGKSISEIDVRKTYHINVLAIKKGGNLKVLPEANYVFDQSDHIIVIGKPADVFKLTNRT